MLLKLRWASLVCLLLPPCVLKNWLLRCCGWQVARDCQVGFSWVHARRVELKERARIGHGNFVSVDVIALSEAAYLGHLNRITGPLWLVMRENAGIGNQNTVTRARLGVTWGRAMLKLGCWSKLTAQHFVDCTRSVSFGDYSTLAGRGSQIWTHGYLHAPVGLDRFRVDGSVRIGNNVYIGSACVVNAGLRVADAITVGSASCVSRSLDRPGMYVSQPLRYMKLDYAQTAQRYPQVRTKHLVDRVLNKRMLD